MDDDDESSSMSQSKSLSCAVASWSFVLMFVSVFAIIGCICVDGYINFSAVAAACISIFDIPDCFGISLSVADGIGVILSGSFTDAGAAALGGNSSLHTSKDVSIKGGIGMTAFSSSNDESDTLRSLLLHGLIEGERIFLRIIPGVGCAVVLGVILGVGRGLGPVYCVIRGVVGSH